MLAPAYLSRGMSKRREPDSNSDGLDVEKLEPQAKRLITALSQRFSGPRQAMTLDQFRQHVHECGFPVSQSSLQRWRTGLSLDPNYFAAKRIPGRPRSLTHEDEELLGGFILHQNRLNLKVTYKDLDASAGRVGRGNIATHTHHLCERRWFQSTSRQGPSQERHHHQKLALGLAFIDELIAADFFKAARHRVYAMDVTHTSHRKVIHKTIAPRGGCVYPSFQVLFLSVLSTFFLTFGRALPWSLQWRYAVHFGRDPRVQQCHRQCAQV